MLLNRLFAFHGPEVIQTNQKFNISVKKGLYVEAQNTSHVMKLLIEIVNGTCENDNLFLGLNLV